MTKKKLAIDSNNRIYIDLGHSTYAYAGNTTVKATGRTLASSVLSYIEGIVEENNRIAMLDDSSQIVQVN